MSNAKSIIHTGDCIEVLKGLPDASVQCVVTSPPYYGLRDYGNEGQIGLEETPEEYVAKMVEVFREVRRVLRDDGTVWLNIGDSYAGSGKGRNADGTHAEGGKQATNKGTVVGSLTKTNAPACKPKDLIGIPWMLAFALRADGWYLRQDIIWHKPNPMPESVTDRCTKAHEYVFLLAKSGSYYFDHEAVKEPYSTADPSSASYRKNGKSDSRKKHAIYCSACDGSGDETDENGDDCQVCGGTGRADIGMAKPAAKNEGFWKPEGTGRNRRSVWTINTKPFKGAHFAVMPEALVGPCVLAGTSEKGCCAACGAPWRRVTGRPCPQCASLIPTQGKECAACGHRNTEWREERERNASTRAGESDTVGPLVARKTDLAAKSVAAGWVPTCDCAGDWQIIKSPTGEVTNTDPSKQTGRAGMNRPRSAEEGTRPMYRWQQKAYAEQLKNSPHRAEMEAEAGTAFQHYIRTDKSGARPIPMRLLENWLDKGFLAPPTAPAHESTCVPCVVLDPFTGSGTVAVVAERHGRSFVGAELNPDYVQIAYLRIAGARIATQMQADTEEGT